MFSPDSAASLPPQPKKQTWSSYIMQSSSSSSSARLVFLPSLPTPAPGPNKMSPCVTCQAGRRFHFRIFYILPFFLLVVFLCTCSALSLTGTFSLLGRSVIRAFFSCKMFVSTFFCCCCHYHSYLPRRRLGEGDVTSKLACPVSISAGALLLVDARSSGSGSRAQSASFVVHIKVRTW